MLIRCEHKRIRKNYPFGRKSVPTRKCKDCGRIIKPKDMCHKTAQERKKPKCSSNDI